MDEEPYAMTPDGTVVSRADIHTTKMESGLKSRLQSVTRLDDGMVLQYLDRIGWIEQPGLNMGNDQKLDDDFEVL